MGDFLDKLTSYNLFNYLLPGVVFCAAGDTMTPLDMLHENLVIGVFLYYFVGMVISRIGSVILEPLLKKTRFVAFEPYGDFVAATKEDPKLETLSETNNTYRTSAALFLTLAVVVAITHWLPTAYDPALVVALSAALSLLFLVAYRKQTSFVADRIRENLKGAAPPTKHE